MTSEAACRLACEIETEFLCRSFLYKGPPIGTTYNCQLYHLDHKTLPDGPSTYLNGERPLIDDGQRVGSYYENYCESEPKIQLYQYYTAIFAPDYNKISIFSPESVTTPHDATLPVVFDTTDDPTLNNLTRSDVNCDKTGTCYDGK